MTSVIQEGNHPPSPPTTGSIPVSTSLHHRTHPLTTLSLSPPRRVRYEKGRDCPDASPPVDEEAIFVVFMFALIILCVFVFFHSPPSGRRASI
jgi:hypothetical protein